MTSQFSNFRKPAFRFVSQHSRSARVREGERRGGNASVASRSQGWPRLGLISAII